MAKRKKRKNCRPYPFDFKIKAVKLHLKEGYSKQLLHEELGIGKSTVGKWVKDYYSFGEDDPKTKLRTRKTSVVSSQVKPLRTFARV